MPSEVLDQARADTALARAFEAEPSIKENFEDQIKLRAYEVPEEHRAAFLEAALAWEPTGFSFMSEEAQEGVESGSIDLQDLFRGAVERAVAQGKRAFERSEAEEDPSGMSKRERAIEEFYSKPAPGIWGPDPKATSESCLTKEEVYSTRGASTNFGNSPDE